jgi:hypothetical protein
MTLVARPQPDGSILGSLPGEPPFTLMPAPVTDTGTPQSGPTLVAETPGIGAWTRGSRDEFVDSGSGHQVTPEDESGEDPLPTIIGFDLEATGGLPGFAAEVVSAPRASFVRSAKELRDLVDGLPLSAATSAIDAADEMSLTDCVGALARLLPLLHPATPTGVGIQGLLRGTTGVSSELTPDDSVAGTGTVEQSLVPGPGWHDAFDYPTLVQLAEEYGPGTTIVVLSRRSTTIGHALAIHTDSDGEAFFIDPLAPDRVRPATIVTRSIGALPALGRFIVIGPDGATVTHPAGRPADPAAWARERIKPRLQEGGTRPISPSDLEAMLAVAATESDEWLEAEARRYPWGSLEGLLERCLAQLRALADQLFDHTGIASTTTVDDTVVATEPSTRRLLERPDDWTPIPDWQTLLAHVTKLGMGGAALVVADGGDLKHAFAIVNTTDGPYIADRQAAPGKTGVIPAESAVPRTLRQAFAQKTTGRPGAAEHADQKGYSLRAPVEVRALLVDPTGRALISHQPDTAGAQSNSVTRSILLPSGPHVGMYRYDLAPLSSNTHPEGRYYELTGGVSRHLRLLPPSDRSDSEYLLRRNGDRAGLRTFVFSETRAEAEGDIAAVREDAYVRAYISDDRLRALMTDKLWVKHPEIGSYLERRDKRSRSDRSGPWSTMPGVIYFQGVGISVSYDSTIPARLRDFMIGNVGRAISLVRSRGFDLPNFNVYLPKYASTCQIDVAVNSVTGRDELLVHRRDHPRFNALACVYAPNVMIINPRAAVSPALAKYVEEPDEPHFAIDALFEDNIAALICHEIGHIAHAYESPDAFIDLDSRNLDLIDPTIVDEIKSVSRYAERKARQNDLTEFVAEYYNSLVFDRILPDTDRDDRLLQLYLDLGGPVPRSRRFHLPEPTLTQRDLGELASAVELELHQRGFDWEITPRIVADAHTRLSSYQKRLKLKLRVNPLADLLSGNGSVPMPRHGRGRLPGGARDAGIDAMQRGLPVGGRVVVGVEPREGVLVFEDAPVVNEGAAVDKGEVADKGKAVVGGGLYRVVSDRAGLEPGGSGAVGELYAVDGAGRVVLADGSVIPNAWVRHGADFLELGTGTVLRGDSGWLGGIENAETLSAWLHESGGAAAVYSLRAQAPSLYLVPDDGAGHSVRVTGVTVAHTGVAGITAAGHDFGHATTAEAEDDVLLMEAHEALKAQGAGHVVLGRVHADEVLVNGLRKTLEDATKTGNDDTAGALRSALDTRHRESGFDELVELGRARRPHIDVGQDGVPWAKSQYSVGMGACVEVTVIPA